MDRFFEFINSIWYNHIISDEGLATLLIVLAIALKLFINRKVTKLHFKKMIVSIPSEITFLVIGFLLSAMITQAYTKDIRAMMAIVVIALIVIIIQYALERHLDDKLSGKIGVRYCFYIIAMYAMSVILYYIVVFGGNY